MLRLWLCWSLSLLVGSGAVGGASTAQAQADLAKQAHAILKRHCYRCHGEGGKAESELYVLNHESLVPRRVKPGDPEKSSLLAKIRSGEMPQDTEPLAQADQDTLQKWIAAGAVDFAAAQPVRKLVSPADTLVAIAADLAKIEKTNRDDLPFIRYFTITHLYNAGLDDDQLATYRNALSKLINSLSWGRRVKPPRAVDPQQTLFAIDLRDYKWNERIWDAIVAANPYGVKHDSPSAKYTYKVTGSELPVVRGDWFVAAASRPPLYHQVLQLPETDRELEKLLQVDVDENLRTRKVWRAGFNGSGVSQNNRLIERHESDLTNGAYWKSYDFGSNDGRKNLFAHPLGPKGENAFEHDGGEIIFNLPNGLQAYLLVDSKGQRIDKGPPAIVSDPVQKDRAVVNGLSCMSCHVAGMIRKQDEVREHVEQNRASFTAREVETVQAIYPPAAKFDEFLKEDAARFAEAMQKSGAPVAKQDPIVQLALRFEAELNAKLAAAELGLPVDEFLKALDRSPTLGRTLGSLKVPGRTIKREVFVSTFGDIVKDLGLGIFLARATGGQINIGFEMPPKEYTSQASGMKFALIPAGEFKMGSSAADVRAAFQTDSTAKEEDFKAEQPQHPVRITKPFYMGVYEVTQEEFQKMLGRNTSYFSATSSDKNYRQRVSGLNTSRFPVENVTWFDAIEFCNKLSEADGRAPYYRLTSIERTDDQSVWKANVTVVGTGYRLPTEAEWEYACRANTTTPFHFGSALYAHHANADVDRPSIGSQKSTLSFTLRRTTAVDDPKYLKNAFGLAQMHGNVWEWCEDSYYDWGYLGRSQTTTTNDPLYAADFERRALRGGSWDFKYISARSASRLGSHPGSRSKNNGFRVVVSSLP